MAEPSRPHFPTHLKRLLEELELEENIRRELGPRVAVSHYGARVFLYTRTQKQAEAAERLVRDLLAEHNMHAKLLPLIRWHPVEKRWEDASLPLPRSAAETEAEHERWEEEQAKETRALGYAEWEVRVELPSHKDADTLANRLEEEGIRPIVRRWRYLLIGVENDDEARALAERIRAEAPEGSIAKAEPSMTIAWELTAKNPFANFGAFGPGPTIRYDAADADLEQTYGHLSAGNVVYGHIHRPFVRRIGRLTVANSGSVSLPWDGDPRASYLWVDDGGPAIVRVAYDVDRDAASLLDSGHPDAIRLAEMRRSGRFVPLPSL